MEAYKRVAAARAKGRPTGSDFIEHIFEGFVELHGDRRFADDKAIVAGVAMLKDMPVTVIAIDRGKDTKEKIKRNFGSAHPEGYRKALRQMKLAEKFNRPVICFIDTSGAYCGIGAEERGQAQAIAENLMEMMTLKVPIISIFTGEGRERRRSGARSGRRGLDAGKRGLLGHLAGGLCQHPLEGRLQDKGSLRVLEAHRRGAFKPQGGRAFNPRAEGPKGRL